MGARRCIAILALPLLAACGGLQAGPSSPFQDIDASLAALEQGYSATAITACLAEPIRGASGESHRLCRDRISQSLMAAIDVRYAIYEQRLLDAQRGVGALASITQIGLSAAASVITGGTSQSLSAAATAVGGAQEVFSREVLINRTATALQAAMHAQRNQVGLRIRSGLAQSAEVYPLGAALSDLMAYYRAGTLIGATVALSEAAGRESRSARDDLDATVGITRSTPVQRNLPGAPAPATVIRPALASGPPPVPAVQGGSGRADTASARRLAGCLFNETRSREQREAALRTVRTALVADPDGPRLVDRVNVFVRDTTASAEQLRVRILENSEVATACPILPN